MGATAARPGTPISSTELDAIESKCAIDNDVGEIRRVLTVSYR